MTELPTGRVGALQCLGNPNLCYLIRKLVPVLRRMKTRARARVVGVRVPS